MITPHELLAAKELSELQTMLVTAKAGFHHRENKQTLIQRIIELGIVTTPGLPSPPNAIDVPKREIEMQPSRKQEAPKLTKTEVMQRLEKYKSKGLQIFFSDDENYWHIKRQCGVTRTKDLSGNQGRDIPIIKEDSGNMQQPIEVIIRCADGICRGGVLSDVR